MRLRGLGIIAATATLAVAVWQTASAEIHRDSFEGLDPAWVLAGSDASPRETAHDRSEDNVHTGQRAEHIQLQAQTGKFIYYAYDVGRAPLADELTMSVWVKAT